MTHNSGRLHRLQEVDETGYQWAAAAVVPSDSDLDMEESKTQLQEVDENDFKIKFSFSNKDFMSVSYKQLNYFL